jgi:hypothetical protein
MSYNPNDDVPASPGQLRELYDDWRPWLERTGLPAETNSEISFGYEVPEGGTIFDPGAVPIAAQPLKFTRLFLGKPQIDAINFMVPRAVEVLGLGRSALFEHRAAYLPATDLQSAPGGYREATCSLVIRNPIGLDGIKGRYYKLAQPRNETSKIEGTRHDRKATDGSFVLDERDLYPRITATEYSVLKELGSVCAMFFASRREMTDPHP